MNERNRPNTSDSAEQPHLQSLATQGVEAIRGGGGTSAFGRLLRYDVEILNAAFNVLRKYRQYYFSRPYLKSLLFNLTNKKQEAQQLKKHVFNSCAEPLQYAKSEFKSSCQSFLLFIKVYKECKAWLNSAEFKEKYKNNPFPPYLNPSLVDYSQINPNLAWDLNLKIPHHYDCLYISNGLSASAATEMFFKTCNVNFIHFPLLRNKEFYKNLLTKYNNQKKNVISLGYGSFMSGYCLYDIQNAKHLKELLPKNIPFFYIVRDPISRIKSALNHLAGSKNIFFKKFNLTFSYQNLIPQAKYWCSDDSRPSFGLFKTSSFFNNDYQWWMIWWQTFLASDSIFSTFKDNIGLVHCINFDDLTGKKGITSFCKAAEFFKFDLPENTEIFGNKVWNAMQGFLPSTLYIHSDDLSKTEASEESLDKEGGFNIIITLPSHLKEEEKSLMDISNEIEENLMRDETRILMLIKENDLKNLKENTPLYQRTIQFLKGYVDAIQNEIERRKSVVFKEEDVLEFFKNNKEQRLFIKNILDNELNYIKQNHPDYIARWKYYLAFEKLCADLDGNEK